MFSRTSRVCLVVLGRGTASAVSVVGVGSSGHSVPHILSMAIGQVAAITGTLYGLPYPGVAGYVIPAVITGGSGSRDGGSSPCFRGSRVVLTQHLRRPSVATAMLPRCAT